MYRVKVMGDFVAEKHKCKMEGSDRHHPDPGPRLASVTVAQPESMCLLMGCI